MCNAICGNGVEEETGRGRSKRSWMENIRKDIRKKDLKVTSGESKVSGEMPTNAHIEEGGRVCKRKKKKKKKTTTTTTTKTTKKKKKISVSVENTVSYLRSLSCHSTLSMGCQSS